MDKGVENSIASVARLNSVLSSINEKISTTSTDIEQFMQHTDEPAINECEFFIPEENHEDLKNSLELLCRLPQLFATFTNNLMTVSSMETLSLIQEYKNVVDDIEEKRNKLAKIAKNCEKDIEVL